MNKENKNQEQKKGGKMTVREKIKKEIDGYIEAYKYLDESESDLNAEDILIGQAGLKKYIAEEIYKGLETAITTYKEEKSMKKWEET